MNDSNPQSESILKKKDVAEFLKCSIRQVEVMVKGGRMPKPFFFGDKSPRWRRSTLMDWLESLQPTNQQAGPEE